MLNKCIMVNKVFTKAQQLTRLDQARLDRSYSSNRANWCEYVKTVEHDGWHVLSDHVPVTTTILLQEGAPPGKKRSTSFKMDVSLLHRPEVMNKVKEAWEEESCPNTDPRIRWDLCLQKVKKVLQDKKWKRAFDKKSKGILADQLWLIRKEAKSLLCFGSNLILVI